MRTIEVLFPETGPPTVIHEREAVVVGEDIAWNIESKNKGVSTVEIDFDDPLATYFNGTKNITKRVESDKVLIVGTAPALKGIQRHKYTVRGLDAYKTPVAELDPMIITVD